MSACLMFVAMLFASVGSAIAGPCNTMAVQKHDFQFLAGYSPASSTWIGSTEDRKFVMAGMTYSYTCWNLRAVDIGYAVGVLPVALLLQPTLQNFRSFTPPTIPAHSVYGVGVLPVGFTVHFGRNVVQPFFETHGGVIASTEPIPINALNSTGLNFLFDFGAGTRIRLDAHEAISVGYKFLHISNGYTTNFNPGVDNNVIFVGFSILR
jgi:hypothetical protein